MAASALKGTSVLDLGLLRTSTTSLLNSPRILVCGDADFAYATALADSLRELQPPAHIFASAYEPEPELLSRYPHAAAAMASLERSGVAVRCGVDAREIQSHYQDHSFHRIIFNLPQSPPAPKARNQIQRHRALLRDFCHSAAGSLAPRGELWITLLAGQGGTPMDPISRMPGDTWQIQQQAATAGLLVKAVASADLDALAAAGYFATGRGKDGKPLGSKRKNKGMVVHVLALEEPCHQQGTSSVAASSDELLTEGLGAVRLEEERLTEGTPLPAPAPAPAPEPVVGVAPLECTLDNSFWLPDELPSEARAQVTPKDGCEGSAAEPSIEWMLKVSQQALGPHAAHVLVSEPALVDVYERPEDGRRARTYRFVYRSDRLALSRDRAIQLNAVVCKAIEENLLLDHRNPVHPSTETDDDPSASPDHSP